MKASVSFLNRYLEPPTLSAQEAEDALTLAGFPIDSKEPLAGGDSRLEVETTSNRGDCLCMIGLAREISARGRHKLNLPAFESRISNLESGPCSDHLTLEVTTPDCPRFTVHIIRNCTVAPSPAWLVQALESVGQRSINNVVDITNFLNFEFGQPCHAFDLAKLAGKRLIVRRARDGEPLTTLDGKKRSLKSDEIVVADSDRAQSLAGVIGGADSEVSASTKDIALEVATWDPVAIRRAARRHQVKTDAGHRFERYVDPRTLDLPARRAAALIAELTKGSLCSGMLDSSSAPSEPLREITLRPSRVNTLLGITIPDAEISSLLQRLEIKVSPSGPSLLCTIPPFRPDLTREVDLIEEVARLKGFDAIPIHPRMSLQVRGPQPSESAYSTLAAALTAQGFFETVTFSFIPPKDAAPFLAPGLTALAVADDRRASDGALRPSTIPSLLACRKKNQDSGAQVAGGIRLYETASVFADPTSGQQPKANSQRPPSEHRTLALLMDLPGVTKGKPGSIDERQHAIRILRGALESAAHTLGGASATIDLVPLTRGSSASQCSSPTSPGSSAAPSPLESRILNLESPFPALDPSASAQVLLNNSPIGWLGLISPSTQKLFDLSIPAAAAEIDLAPLLALYPPKGGRVEPLPAFPAIERDLSLVVDESISWSGIRSLVAAAKLDKLESLSFVGAYRGKQLGPAKKSLTLRLSFRDPSRTLRHEEVDPQMTTLIAKAKSELQAELRA